MPPPPPPPPARERDGDKGPPVADEQKKTRRKRGTEDGAQGWPKWRGWSGVRPLRRNTATAAMAGAAAACGGGAAASERARRRQGPPVADEQKKKTAGEEAVRPAAAAAAADAGGVAFLLPAHLRATSPPRPCPHPHLTALDHRHPTPYSDGSRSPAVRHPSRSAPTSLHSGSPLVHTCGRLPRYTARTCLRQLFPRGNCFEHSLHGK